MIDCLLEADKHGQASKDALFPSDRQTKVPNSPPYNYSMCPITEFGDRDRVAAPHSSTTQQTYPAGQTKTLHSPRIQ
jgi:hypothetical protein